MGNILSTFPQKRKRKVVVGFMGTFVPKSLADYVTLYSNALVVTKISIMQELLGNWVEEKSKEYPTPILEEMVAQNAFPVWEKTEGQSFETFMKCLQFELKKKKLEPAVVGRILKLVEDEKSKNTQA